MKIELESIYITYMGKYYRRSYFSELKILKWYNEFDNIVEPYTQQKLEELYQETLIPTKTLNPSEKEFDLKDSMYKFFNESFGIPNGDQQWVMMSFKNWFKNQYSEKKGFEIEKLQAYIDLLIKESFEGWTKKETNAYLTALGSVNHAINNLLRANGGSPEEGNPVGQTFISEEIEFLIEKVKDYSAIIEEEDEIQAFIENIINKLKSKPLTTTKEQPIEQVCHNCKYLNRNNICLKGKDILDRNPMYVGCILFEQK